MAGDTRSAHTFEPLWVGRWVGSRGTNTVLAALPALLIFLVLPALAVVLAERWLRRREGARTRTGVALAVAFGLQVLVLVGASWLGASARRLGDVALLTLVEAVVLPGVVRRVARRPGPAPISAEGRGLA